MTDGAMQESKGINCRWVGLGVVFGLVIVALSFFQVEPNFGSQAVQLLVAFAGFIFTGVLIGYLSPGVTIKEAGIAGGIVAILMAVILAIKGHELTVNFLWDVVGLFVGIVFALLGGWAGEELQGTLEEGKPVPKDSLTSFQGRWILVGLILGFSLNVLMVIVPWPLFNFNYNFALLMFLVSTAVMGLIVGFKSPGVTIKEPAIAGVLVVLLEWIFIKFILSAKIPLVILAFGLILGFILTLLGAWVGEVIQEKTRVQE